MANNQNSKINNANIHFHDEAEPKHDPVEEAMEMNGTSMVVGGNGARTAGSNKMYQPKNPSSKGPKKGK